MVSAFQKIRPSALLRGFECLLQYPHVSLKSSNVLLIPRASKAFMLQLLSQALSLAMVVHTSRALQLEVLRKALEFSLKLQVRMLPHKLFDPPLRLQPVLALTFQFVKQHLALFTQQFEPLLLIAK